MHLAKNWITAPRSPAAEDLAASLRTSPLIAQILLNRGLASPEECQTFLSPNLKHLHDPSLMPNLKCAAERITAAIRNREKIVIYGDYDVDGITATTILWHAIQLLGGNVDYYIPHRLDEGYGLNAEALRLICDQGAQLIVTVDCGITAIDEAEIPRERGIDLIITDHHEWRESPDGNDHCTLLPKCHSIVHPRLPQTDAYPNPALCGAGVAFKVAWGIGQAHAGTARVSDEFRAFLMEALSLAALGTIADVVPLHGENRTLAHFGLMGLKQSKLQGVRALIANAGLTGKTLDTYHAGFLLAPRLNACGRMGHAALAVEMLTRADEARANEISNYLAEQNRTRQAVERQIFQEAEAQVRENNFDAEHNRGIVLASENWHAGVIGIVASRIVSRFNRPAILIALSNNQGQGSARSIPGFHLAKALDACRAHLLACGGHEMAAGLRLQQDQLTAFREEFCAYASREITTEMLAPQLHLDCSADLAQITEPVVVGLQRLGPFGTGNRKPLLCCTDLELAATPRRVGKSQEHLQLYVRQGRASMKCIAFNHGHLFERLQPGIRIDLAVEPTVNDFNGRRSVELEVKDIRFQK